MTVFSVRSGVRLVSYFFLLYYFVEFQPVLLTVMTERQHGEREGGDMQQLPSLNKTISHTVYHIAIT